MSNSAGPVLEMRGISKSFPGVVALDDVSFDCHAGEVHVICGENGAGKSTLMKVLGGSYLPDAGSILIDGVPVRLEHPLAARAAGIAVIHQELTLLPERTVAENLFLGREAVRFGLLDRRTMRRGAREVLARLASGINPDRRCGELSLSEMQIVEIAKALSLDARILVLDEPTAALDAPDAERLLGVVRQLRDAGVALVYISHRMAEVTAIADRVTVLKDGRRVGTLPAASLSVPQIVRMMVGREVAELYPPIKPGQRGEALLRVEGGGNAVLADIDFELRAGEITGVAGLEGSGKSALAQAIFGDAPFRVGRVLVEGRELALTSPRQAIAVGIGYLSDDRKSEGLALRQSVLDNAALVRRGFGAALRRAGGDGETAAALDQAGVRAASYAQAVRLLSGGNQQKTIVARWLLLAPRVLLFVEPTRGIDVAAKAAIYQAMRDYVAGGRAILMASSDLPEVIGASDRIVVMRAGRIVGELAGGASEEEVMSLAVGHAAPAEAMHALV
jgi:ribose transport system ATP-binding protein